MYDEMVLTPKQIESKIFSFRGVQVMVDKDLAELYQLQTKVFNQAVTRNIERFPENFRFQLTLEETRELVASCDRFGFVDSFKTTSRSQIVTLNTSRGQNIKYLPYAFTEQGVAMLSAVLRSEIAIKISIQIINAFVEMRKLIANHHGLLQRMEGVERKLLETDQKFEQVCKALESKYTSATRGVFFDGQV